MASEPREEVKLGASEEATSGCFEQPGRHTRAVGTYSPRGATGIAKVAWAFCFFDLEHSTGKQAAVWNKVAFSGSHADAVCAHVTIGI